MLVHRELSGVRGQSGLTLIETMVSCLILTVVVLFMAQLFGLVIVMNKNNGSDATKAVVVAQAKLEELAILSFSDTTSDTAVDPPASTGGAGLAGGGSLTTRTAHYIDFVDVNGAKVTVPNDLSTPSTAAYVRLWQIVDDSATLKRILVSATSVRSFQNGAAPSTTLVTYKSQ
ncbi:MAG: prepilin-type N-terminal cleavage/methylation domain-containing protein [Acidobacteria bacterium]|nr:prepilin-type N-terminal cleavage/methylation domain-containing protein [Acidobacteriota bacterium]